MVERSHILNFLSANKQDISRKYRLKKLGIFGSYARGEQTTESDLDLLLNLRKIRLIYTRKRIL